MRIKIGCLNKDEIYAKSFADSFSVKYDYIFEIYLFNSIEEMSSKLRKFEIDILIADINLKNKLQKIKCPILYLDNESEFPNKIKRFSKAEDFCETINSLYLEKSGNKNKLNKSRTKFILCSGAFGGSGITTVSSSLSMFLSKQYKVLYLNLDPYENIDKYIDGEFDNNFEDIIFNLKSRTKNKPKAEFGQSKNMSSLQLSPPYSDAGAYLSLSPKDIADWIKSLIESNIYDYIILEIINTDIFNYIDLIRRAYRILIITNDQMNYFEKTDKFLAVFKDFEKTHSISVTDKLRLIYNKSDEKAGDLFKDVKVSGSIPTMEGSDNREIINLLATEKMFMDFI